MLPLMGRASEDPVHRATGPASSNGADPAPPEPARARRGNPYVAGNAVGGSDAFVGREDVIRAVVRALAEPQNQGLVLYGQRRIGKTSILQHLAATLPARSGHRPVYFDLQDKAASSLDEVLADLACEIAEALGLPDPAPGTDVEAWFRDAWLPQILGALPEGVSLVVLFDEFDVLVDVQAKQAAAALFPYLRKLLEKNAPRLRAVFVFGRNIDDLENVAHALFKGIPSWQVSLLGRKDAEALIRLSEANGTVAWSEEAVGAAWGLTHGHPLLLQALCGQVWVHAREDRPPEDATRPVSAEEVEAAVEPTLSSSRNAFEWLWRGLPPGTRVVAAALAQAGPEAVEEEALHQVLRENGVRVIIRELQAAPKVLVDWDLVEAPAPGRYQFRRAAPRRLIARYKPPARVQEDLDLVEPVAETCTAPAGLYRIGNLAAATTQLQGALGLNPNHIKASGLLADILIAQQNWAGARAVLERLYENNPAVARARLVQVLLVQAEADTTEDAKLELYVRVQAIDNKNAAAITGIKEIWKVRGDDARRAGDLPRAIAAYHAGGLSNLEAEVVRKQRADAMADALNEVRKLEDAEAYGDALEGVQGLAKEYGDLREPHDWRYDIARLEGAAETRRTYERGVGGHARREHEAAKDAFAAVIARRPDYKDAATRLQVLVTGMDTAALFDAEKKAHAKARARVASLEDRLAITSGHRETDTAVAKNDRRQITIAFRFQAVAHACLVLGALVAGFAPTVGVTLLVLAFGVWLPAVFLAARPVARFTRLLYRTKVPTMMTFLFLPFAGLAILVIMNDDRQRWLAPSP